MSETRVRKRRSRSNRTSEQLQTAVWIVFTIALFGALAMVGVYAFNRFTERKANPPPVAANPANPANAPNPANVEANRVAAPAPSVAGSISFEDVLHESYHHGSIVPWRTVGPGHLTSTTKGFTLEMTITETGATITGVATIKRNRDGEIDRKALVAFEVYLLPESKPRQERLGAAGLAECKVLQDVHDESNLEFTKKLKDPSPTATATKRGKVLEATATFTYDETTKKVKYRMEIKKIAG